MRELIKGGERGLGAGPCYYFKAREKEKKRERGADLGVWRIYNYDQMDLEGKRGVSGEKRDFGCHSPSRQL